MKGKQKERVEQFGEQAILSKKLATIIIDVPVPWDEEDLVYTGPDVEKLKPIIEELEFKTMAPRIYGLLSGAPVVAASAPKPSQLSMFGLEQSEESTPAPGVEKKLLDKTNVSYRQVETAESRRELILKLKDQKQFSFEVHTDEAVNFDFVATSFACSYSPGESFYVPLGSDAQHILNEFSEIFAEDRIGKVGHNIKSSILVLKKYGIYVKGNLFDTMLAHYLIEPEASHNFSILCGQYLDYYLDEETESFESACERADLALQIKSKIEIELQEKFQSLLPWLSVSCQASLYPGSP